MCAGSCEKRARLSVTLSLQFTLLEAGERPASLAWIFFYTQSYRGTPPRASTRPLPLPCARGARSPPVFVSSFSKLFCSVSDLGMGCGNKSGLFAVFYHLMMANHRLLDCSHGNGSGFQHPASPCCARSFSQRAREKCEGQRAGRGQLLLPPAARCPAARCSPAARCLPQPARPARSLQLGQPGGWGPCSPATRSCSLLVGWDPAAGAARRFPGQGRQGSEGLEGNQGSEEQPSQAEVRLAMALGAFLGAQGEPQRVSRPEIILLLHGAFKT